MQESYSSKQFKEGLKSGSIKVKSKGTPKSGNRKVCNAVKCSADGHKFDSKLEMSYYFLLKYHNFKFELKKRFVLSEKSENVRTIVWNADYFMDEFNLVMDTKGNSTDTFKLKLKLFKKMIDDGKLPKYTIWLIKDKSQFTTALICLKERLKGNISPLESNLTV